MAASWMRFAAGRSDDGRGLPLDDRVFRDLVAAWHAALSRHGVVDLLAGLGTGQ